MAKALSPLTKSHPPGEVLDKLSAYLHQVEPRFASPTAFARGYDKWGADDYDAEGWGVVPTPPEKLAALGIPPLVDAPDVMDVYRAKMGIVPFTITDTAIIPGRPSETNGH